MANRVFPEAVGPRMIMPGYALTTRLSKPEVIADAGQQKKDQGKNDDSQYLRLLAIHFYRFEIRDSRFEIEDRIIEFRSIFQDSRLKTGPLNSGPFLQIRDSRLKTALLNSKS